MSDSKPITVTIKTACKIAGIGRTTMWKLICDGRIATVRIGRRRLVSYHSLEALLTATANGTSAAA